MPPQKKNRGEVLCWDQVYGQFADAAAATPIEAIDRELSARGFGLDRLRGAAGRLGRRRMGYAGECTAAALRARVDERLPRHLPMTLQAVEGLRPPSGMRRWWAGSAMAGAVGAAMVALLVLPVSDGLVGHRPATKAAATDTERSPAGSPLKFAQATPPPTTRSVVVPGRNKAQQSYYLYKVEAEMLESCVTEDPDGPCDDDLKSSAADGLGKRMEKGKATDAKTLEPPRPTVLASVPASSSGAKG